METHTPPSLFNKIIGPTLFLVGGFSALIWFFYRIIFLIQNLSEPFILFDKGSYYMLGVGIGLLSLGFVTAIEFWGKKPITTKQSTIFSRLTISAIILAFLVPHTAHFTTDYYLEKQGYSVCEEASSQWLFIRDIAYIQSSVECNEDLIKQ